MPALLKSTSRRPNSRLVRAKSSRTAAGSPTSLGTMRVLAPLVSCATCSSISLRRPERTTAYPSWARASAADLPTPDPAPVTSATFVLVAMDSASACFDCLEVTSSGEFDQGAAASGGVACGPGAGGLRVPRGHNAPTSPARQRLQRPEEVQQILLLRLAESLVAID